MLYIDNYESKINHYIDNIATKYLNFPTVIGFGLSFKEINGYQTSTPCLTFLVKEKLSTYELNPQYILPKTIDSIITDTIETGEFTTSTSGSKYTVFSDNEERIDKYRPAFGGLSCSNANLPEQCEGCISAAVTYANPTEKDALLFLGCNHVLTRDFVGKVTDPILQPARRYTNSHRLAGLHFVKSISPRKTDLNTAPKDNEWNYFNCALASVGYLDDIHQQIFLRPGLGLNKNDYIPIYDTSVPKLGNSVWKIGPYPKLTKTQGKITATNLTLSSININGNIFAFKNQALASVQFNKGDAGALLMETAPISKKNFSVGMCFATTSQSNKDFTVFTPIDDVLKALRIKFIK